MSSYGSIWVKIDHPETDLPLLQEKYNAQANLPAGLNFACAIKDESHGETPEGMMVELSRRFGEAIFMCVQTTVDFFIYSHWRDGEQLRQIHYCADEGWYDLSGEKEAWELRMFDEAEKMRQLSYLDLERLAKNPDSAEYANAQLSLAEIEETWGKKELIEESFYPMAIASEIYGIAMQEFGLADPYS